MTTKEPEIRIKVGDWAAEYHEVEPNIAGEDDLVRLATREKMNTAKVARLAMIARELGNAPANILPENKPLLMSGGAVAISSVIARRHKEVELENGKTFTVREFVAPVRDDAVEYPQGYEEEEGHHPGDTQAKSAPSLPLPESFAPVISDEAKGRALDYLYKRVPGYIMGRLKIIAINGGDVKTAAEEIKHKIDEMVERLG